MAVRIKDGSLDFSAGVDSGRVTTVLSPANPNGLPRNMLAWLINGTVRNGGITQRPGWVKLCKVHDSTALYQGGYLYNQTTGNPYLVFSIGGLLFQVRVDTNNSVNAMTPSGQSLENPAAVGKCYMEQAEQFLIVQAGDWAVNQKGTNPLFWDGKKLTRSVGIISANNTPAGGVTPFNQIPAALSMSYYQGRLWYSNARKYTAGDIVGDSASGTVPYGFTDAVLMVTENPLALGGDGFTVPSGAGDITALNWTAQIDATLGQGNLYIFTARDVFALTVPVSRTDWIAASANNQPRQVVALTGFGTVSDRSIVRVNGDLFFASPEPAWRSFTAALRYFQQWGNVPISRNIQRALDFTSPNLMAEAPSILFDNRLLMGLIPVKTPVGNAYQVLGALNFDLISTLQTQLPPAWEGALDGLDILQLFQGNFGGQQRAFAAVHNRTTHDIEVWELTAKGTSDNAGNRVEWQVETPAYTFGNEFELKTLDGAEIWVDSVVGKVDMTFQYRPDADSCWQNWCRTEFCAAASPPPNGYPQPTFCPGFKFPVRLPKPRPQECESMTDRPVNIGYQFQMRVTIKGYCRIRGIILYAIKTDNLPFDKLNCE